MKILEMYMRVIVIAIYSILIISLLSSCECTQQKLKSQLFIQTNILNSSFDGFSKSELVIDEGKIFRVTNVSYKSLAKDSIVTGYVYPGFIDAHCHFVGYAKGLTEANLFATKSFEEALERLVQFKLNNPEVSPIFGRGWDQNDWEIKEFPNNTKLSELFPETPVILTRIDGHATLLNEKAMQIFNIDKKTVVEGGVVEIHNDKLTGILIDNATSLVAENVDWNKLKSNLLTAEQNCFAVGLTTLDDAGLDLASILFLDSLQKSKELKMRLYIMASDNSENFDYFMRNGPIKTERLSVRSFKFYADGSLGSRGACLLHGYKDDKGNFGLMLSAKEHFKESAEILMENGFQMNTHAIGDSANHVLLNVYKDVLKGDNDFRWRIEHAQVVADGDLSLFEEYSVLPSVQPTHATSDMYWAEERLGSEHINDLNHTESKPFSFI